MCVECMLNVCFTEPGAGGGGGGWGVWVFGPCAEQWNRRCFPDASRVCPSYTSPWASVVTRWAPRACIATHGAPINSGSVSWPRALVDCALVVASRRGAKCPERESPEGSVSVAVYVVLLGETTPKRVSIDDKK